MAVRWTPWDISLDPSDERSRSPGRSALELLMHFKPVDHPVDPEHVSGIILGELALGLACHGAIEMYQHPARLCAGARSGRPIFARA